MRYWFTLPKEPYIAPYIYKDVTHRFIHSGHKAVNLEISAWPKLTQSWFSILTVTVCHSLSHLWHKLVTYSTHTKTSNNSLSTISAMITVFLSSCWILDWKAFGNKYIITLLPCISKNESFLDWSRFLVRWVPFCFCLHNYCIAKWSVFWGGGLQAWKAPEANY